MFKLIKERFDFVNGLIGNFFFVGARLFFCLMDVVIFLYFCVSCILDDMYIVLCFLYKENECVNFVVEFMNGMIFCG